MNLLIILTIGLFMLCMKIPQIVKASIRISRSVKWSSHVSFILQIRLMNNFPQTAYFPFTELKGPNIFVSFKRKLHDVRQT